MEKIKTKTSQPILKRQIKVCIQNSAWEIIKWLFSGTMSLVENSYNKQLLELYLSYLMQKKWKFNGKDSVLTMWRVIKTLNFNKIKERLLDFISSKQKQS